MSIWILTPDRRDLRCHDLFDATPQEHSEGVVLTAAEYPAYFAALESGLAIDAHDAREDSRTREFGEGYLEPLGITSMLDAAVRRDGRVVGVVCHEHVGPPRRWSADEVSFAGAIAEHVAIALEAAERHHAEERLEGLLSELTHALATAERAVKDREELLSIVSHELRGPLTSLGLAMEGALDVARQAGAHPPGEGAGLLRFLEMAHRQTARLRRLLDSLLDLARVQAGLSALDVRDLDLAELLRDVIAFETTRSGAHVASVTLQASRPVIGRWDPVRLELVAHNLISNALKYGEGKPVTVSVDQEGDVARLTVADQGRGIAPEDRSRIFRCYERAHADTTSDGLGLGLYIVERVAGAHGGSVEVESTVGSGARFIVTLPLRPA